MKPAWTEFWNLYLRVLALYCEDSCFVTYIVLVDGVRRHYSYIIHQQLQKFHHFEPHQAFTPIQLCRVRQLAMGYIYKVYRST